MWREALKQRKEKSEENSDENEEANNEENEGKILLNSSLINKNK